MTDTVVSIREYIPQEIPEGGVGRLTFEIVDDQERPVPLASLITLVVTLWDELTQPAVADGVINGRDAQNIKNANGGTVTEVLEDAVLQRTEGLLILGAADNVVRSPGQQYEVHIARFEWTWTGGAGPGRKELAITVRNLSRTP